MIRTAWRALVRFLGSAWLALGLLGFLGIWSGVSTLVPQDSDAKKPAWLASHQAIEPVVRALGLHHAFTAPIFIAVVLVLSICTAMCAWRRTKVALSKMQALREAASLEAEQVAEHHDVEIACNPSLGRAEVLAHAAAALEGLGIKTEHDGEMLASVSPWWSVWGSPVFHWGLLALTFVILASSLSRADGLMGVGVGETLPDAPASYGLIHAGPLHNWGAVHRSIRLDSFDLTYHNGGIDRGPTPFVTVLDAAGHAIKSQPVYPNAPLQTGSLTIHRSDFGLAVSVSLENSRGAVTGRFVQLVDFSAATTEGTIPTRSFSVADSHGNPLVDISAAVPLDLQSKDVLKKALPKQPRARFVVTTADGSTAVDKTLKPGESLTLPTGDQLTLAGVDYYARLNVVDDATIPFLDIAMLITFAGLTITVVARQQYVLATIVEGADGLKLAVSLRLWRNASTDRKELVDELIGALGGAQEKESIS